MESEAQKSFMHRSVNSLDFDCFMLFQCEIAVKFCYDFVFVTFHYFVMFQLPPQLSYRNEFAVTEEEG